MANISPVIQVHAHTDLIEVVKWETVTEADAPVAFKPRTGWIGHDVTVMCTGTFGGGTITFKGSLDPANVVAAETLHKTDLADLALTAVGIFGVNEAVFFILPVRTGGASMDVDIFVMFGGSR